jgi:hypothetical protein
MKLGEINIGLREGNADQLVLTALRLPKDDVEKVIYNLYVSCGKRGSSEDMAKCVGYSAYRPTLANTGCYGVQYSPNNDDDDDVIPWWIPQWALVLALYLRSLVRDAESIGREQGYDRGLQDGKSFVVQLASGEMSMNDFPIADGRDDRRLNRKKW